MAAAADVPCRRPLDVPGRLLALKELFDRGLIDRDVYLRRQTEIAQAV